MTGGALFLNVTTAESKTSILFCGTPGNCKVYPYKPQGGWQSICAKNNPCYLTQGCTGEQVCEQPSSMRSQ